MTMQDIHISIVTIFYVLLCYKKFNIHVGIFLLLKIQCMCNIDNKAYNKIRFYQTLKTSYDTVLTATFVQLIKYLISPTFGLCMNTVYISTMEHGFIYLGSI